jgi:two-component system chemotaxis sensor kinase CheA
MTCAQGGQEIDLNRFNQVFFEECAELLSGMEQILLTLEDGEPDGEQLNAIFRAAHSIKGGAGIFEFQDMTVVTHHLESLLDRLRNREIPFTPAMIDLFLEAGDVIAMQLAGHRDGSAVSEQAVELICGKLQRLVGEDGCAEPAEAAAAASCGDPAGERRRYQLCFRPDADIFRRGVRVEHLFRELEELGELTVSAELCGVEELSEFDPQNCSVCWNFTLLTSAGEPEIRDIFSFVAEEEQLQVVEMVEAAAPPAGTAGGEETSGKAGAGEATAARRGADADSSIRVGVAKVDQLINQVGELVITQAMVAQTAADLDPVLHANLHRALAQLERTTRDLQQSVMSIRLMPISLVFNRFPRMVRDLAAKLGKLADLKTVGEATELDKGLIEKITDPLSHLVRNALDHALETPEVRVACGKHPVGSLTLRASQVGGRVVIEVIDDGAGLNREKILQKAKERGLAVWEGMSDDEVWQLIFAPGFSTAELVTDISGRGVGMDVVLSNVQSIGGRVSIASQPGQGTRVTVSLPLTLAIMEGLSVGIGDHKYIVPLNAIVESLQPAKESLKTVNGQRVVQIRGEYLPIVPLHELFNLETQITDPEAGILMLVDVEGEKAALLVDSLLDELQVVVKNIEDNYRKVEGTAGATILGDGRVALILDVHSLLQMRNKTKERSY